ncbi:MAG: helix-turn-helix transcriptional regulator [Acidimicrobiales bacterium]
MLGRLDGVGPDLVEIVAHVAVDKPETVIVLDGVEELSASTLAELTSLAMQAPETLHLVLSSRYDLLAVAGAVRRRHGVVVLFAEDIAFDRDEIGELGGHIGIQLTPAEIERLWTRTEGWPLVVHAAVQAAGGPRSVPIEDLAEVEPLVDYYLKTEVINRLPQHLQQFAVTTSAPDRFSVSLAQALVGDNGSASLVDALVRHGVPLRVCSDETTFLSYPPVLTGWLRTTLRANDPRREEALLRLAAEWHLARGELVRPIDYLLRAGAFDEATEVMITNAHDLYHAGHAVDALSWTRAIPHPVRRARPEVTLLLAAMCQRAGETFEADALLDELDDVAGGTAFSGWIDTLRCLGVEYHHPASDALARARRILDDTNSASHEELGRPNTSDERGHRSSRFQLTGRHMTNAALVSGGRALLGLGHFTEAREWCTAGLADPATTPDLRVQLLGVLGRAEAKTGLLCAAERHAAQALAPVKESTRVDDSDRADAYLARAIAALERANHDDAADLLDAAESRARSNRRTSLLAAIVAERARIALAAGHIADGLTALEQFYAAGDPDPPPAVSAGIVAVEARLWLASGELVRAAHVLAAENLLTVEIAAARAQLAFAAHDNEGLLVALATWQDLVDGDELLAAVHRLLWSSCAAQLSGDTSRARLQLDEALWLAGPEELTEVFLEAGPATLRQLAQFLPTSRRSRLANKIWGTSPRSSRHIEDGPRIASDVEALSERELTVLRHLSRDLDEGDLAAELYISVNTLKTHLKHIYRKLGVRTRLQAVLCARELGLLDS